MFCPFRLVFAGILAVSVIAQSSGPMPVGNLAKVLIFSRTVDFRHDSIPTAIEALKSQGPSHNIQFDNTEDQTLFTDSNLNKYDAIIFLSTTGEVLDDSGIQALQRWVNDGGNFIGLHASSDAMRNNTFYGNEIGAHFRDHANLQNATITVIDSSHPSTSMLPERWHVQDEMYHFKSDPRKIGATVLLSADPSTFNDQTAPAPQEGDPTPKAWYQEHGAGADAATASSIGRSWYTSLGHMNETWQDPLFMQHVMGGIAWALASNTTRAFNSDAKVGNSNSEPTATDKPEVSGTTSSPSNSSQSLSPSSTNSNRASTPQLTLTTMASIIAACLLLTVL